MHLKGIVYICRDIMESGLKEAWLALKGQCKNSVKAAGKLSNKSYNSIFGANCFDNWESLNASTSIDVLRRRFNISRDLKQFDYTEFQDEKSLVKVFSFKDKFSRTGKQIKISRNTLTNEEMIQARQYAYNDDPFLSIIRKKCSKINQYVLNRNSEEMQEKVWNFYYPKDSSPVKFSRITSDEGIVDNFLRADGCVTTENGLKIRPVSLAEYDLKKEKLGVKNFVDAPWTTKESITSVSCATDKIEECTAIGIAGENGVSLNHINPYNSSNNYENTVSLLKSQLKKQGKNPKVFIIGSSDLSDSKAFNQKIAEFFDGLKIKYTRLRTGNEINHMLCRKTRGAFKQDVYKNSSEYEWLAGQHIMYDDGELLISNILIDSEMKTGNLNPNSLIEKSFQFITLG